MITPGANASYPQQPGLVSVVIPAYDAAATLGIQLEALSRQRTSRSFEVIVADNGSRDATRDVATSFSTTLPCLRVVDASERTGSNVARNAGTRAARGDLVLLCDADDVVDEDWLEHMAQALDHDDAVGGRLDQVALNPHLVGVWPNLDRPQGIAVQLGFLPRPISANAGFRRDVWEELGGFDEDYVRGGAETEFFWRLQLAGHTLVDVPEAVVHYRWRSTEKALVKQNYVWARQHAMLFRDFRGHGLRWSPRLTALLWVKIGWSLARIGTPGGRLDLRRHLAYQAGRIVGSVRYRVFFP